MKKILIVEDNIDIHNLIKEILENKKYKVIDSYSGTEAFMVLEKEKIDLILLDLMLPGLNGEEIIKKVKEIPIIVISAKLTPESKVNALLSGANDYITKPFDPQQLRIYQNTIQTSNRDIKYKDLLLKEDEHVIYLKEEKIYLTKTEYAILKQLLLNPNKIVTKSRLLELISNDTLDGDENSLKVHISNIRKKMRKISQEEYIESVWGIGFKIY